MTIPDEAVQAMPERIYAVKQTEGSNCVVSFDTPSLDYNVEYVRADLALPFLQGVKVKGLEWSAAKFPESYVSKNSSIQYSITWDDDAEWSELPKPYDLCRGDSDGEALGSYETANDAKAAAQSDYEARILSAIEVSVCQTCKGHGIIGGLYRVGDGDVDGWEEACPDCAPSPRAQALEEAAKLCEKYAQSYQSGLCHYGSIDKDAGRGRQEGHINAGNELAAAIRALSSQPVADGWRSMDSAPTNGKHCILCIKDGSFYYSVQGAFQNGKWNCVYRDDVQPLCWMPNVRVPAQFLPASPGASDTHPTGGSDD
ncbi:hypothetical protein [Brucella sp.]|uniref:hypothetical protein n=1 Tax=Brucella sp. TaxID=52132 RepID=UPI0028AF4487|nr:hypothetical protein [Brucella sp.]